MSAILIQEQSINTSPKPIRQEGQSVEGKQILSPSSSDASIINEEIKQDEFIATDLELYVMEIPDLWFFAFGMLLIILSSMVD